MMRPTELQLRNALFSDDETQRRLALHHISYARHELVHLAFELLREGKRLGPHDHVGSRVAGMIRTTDQLDEYLELLPVIRDRWLGDDMVDPSFTLVEELPPAVLLERQNAVRKTIVVRESMSSLDRRLAWLRREPRACLRALSAFGRRNAERLNETPDTDVQELQLAAESAARDPEAAREWFLPLLPRLEVLPDEYPQGDLFWTPDLTLKIAGMARIREAAPLLVRCLASHDDYIVEAAHFALPLMLDDAVLGLLDDSFDSAPERGRTMAAETAGHCEGDGVVSAVSRWFDVTGAENELEVVAGAAIDLLDSSLLPRIERVVTGVKWEIFRRELGTEFQAACAIFGVTPERPTAVERACAKAERRYERTWGGMFRRIEETIQGNPDEITNTVDEPIRVAAPRETPGFRAGPNEPCPCGSGKKFKKCCMNKPAVRG